MMLKYKTGSVTNCEARFFFPVFKEADIHFAIEIIKTKFIETLCISRHVITLFQNSDQICPFHDFGSIYIANHCFPATCRINYMIIEMASCVYS